MDAHDEQYVMETRPARLIAVANRINLQAALTEVSFCFVTLAFSRWAG